MRVIKRYANRKLYDTEARRYVTLDEVGHLVREGVDVQVLDKESGEDLTSVTLSQIVLEREKKRPSRASKTLFTSVLQRGAKIRDVLVEKGGRLFGEGLDAALQRLRIPSRAEFEALNKRIRALEEALGSLQPLVPAADPRKRRRGP